MQNLNFPILLHTWQQTIIIGAGSSSFGIVNIYYTLILIFKYIFIISIRKLVREHWLSLQYSATRPTSINNSQDEVFRHLGYCYRHHQRSGFVVRAIIAFGEQAPAKRIFDNSCRMYGALRWMVQVSTWRWSNRHQHDSNDLQTMLRWNLYLLINTK